MQQHTNRQKVALTTGPDVHWLAVRVLSQHLWGQIPRSSCKTCEKNKYTRVKSVKEKHLGQHDLSKTMGKLF